MSTHSWTAVVVLCDASCNYPLPQLCYFSGQWNQWRGQRRTWLTYTSFWRMQYSYDSRSSMRRHAGMCHIYCSMLVWMWSTDTLVDTWKIFCNRWTFHTEYGRPISGKHCSKTAFWSLRIHFKNRVGWICNTYRHTFCNQFTSNNCSDISKKTMSRRVFWLL